MSEENLLDVRHTPTDPSLEFDMLEMARVRLAQALGRHGHDAVDAERAALYVVEAMRPMTRFMKVIMGMDVPEDDEVVGALDSLLGDTQALGRAKAVLAGAEREEAADSGQE